MIKKILATITFIVLSCQVTAKDIYVSLQGNDSWSGERSIPNTAKTDGPLRSLSQAKIKVAKLLNKTNHNSGINVHIDKGVYQLRAALHFSARDSSPTQNVTWQGQGTETVISAGERINTCKQQSKTLWECDVRNLKLNNIAASKNNRLKGNAPNFHLYVNGNKMVLARWPNKGWAHIKQPLNKKRQFTFFNSKGLKTTLFKDAQVYIWPGNDWFDHYAGIEKIEKLTKKITLSSDAMYTLASGRRFIIRNIEGDLDSDYEWFYNPKKEKIHLILPEGTLINTAYVTPLENAVIIDNSINLEFKNLTFKHSKSTNIKINKSKYINLIDLEITNSGGTGIEVKKSTNINISTSKIHNVGMGGITLEGGDRKGLIRSNNVVENTHIFNIGQTLANYTPAISLGGVGATIRHCLIENTPGLGILINGNEHLIEKSELHHLCQQADDCGAIYSGRDWTYRGNVIRYNSIHDMHGYGLDKVDVKAGSVKYKRKGGRGVYLDDGVSGFKIYGNIFNDAGSIALQVGGGRDNHIYNNIFITNNYAILLDNRWPGYKWEVNRERLRKSAYLTSIWRAQYPKLSQPMNNDSWPEGNVIEKNIIVTRSNSAPAVRYFLPRNSNLITKNIVWSESGDFKVDYKILDEDLKKGAVHWAEWSSERIETNSINEDPCLDLSSITVISCKPALLDSINFIKIPSDIGLK